MPQLRSDSLSFLEALGQSVANVSPTLTPAVCSASIWMRARRQSG